MTTLRRPVVTLIMLLVCVAITACHHVRDDLYPRSRTLLERRYSASHWEVAATATESSAAIARWYTSHFGTSGVDDCPNAAIVHRTWDLPDRSVELFIVDHGKRRSIYVREDVGRRRRNAVEAAGARELRSGPCSGGD